MFKNISIRNKLVILQTTTAFVVVLICCAIFIINDLNLFKSSAERKMYSIARIVGSNSISPLLFSDKEVGNEILSNLNTEPDIIEAILLEKTGNVFSRYTRKGIVPLTNSFQFHRVDSNLLLESEFYENELFVSYSIYQNKEFIGTVVLRTKLTDLRKITLDYLKIAGGILLFGLFISILISFFLQGLISKRILLLVSKTKEIAQTGNYSLRITSEGGDEIGILSNGFNEMLKQIELMQASLKEINLELEERVKKRTFELETSNKDLESFSYSVSHDLRAPLRAINGFAKILSEKYNNLFDKEGKELLTIIINEAIRMSRLIDDLLAFSRLGRKKIETSSIDMTSLAKDVVNEVLKLSENKYKAKIIVNNLPPAKCDSILMRQVFSNLILNALKYSSPKPNPLIEIGSYTDGSSTVYYIKDNGVGFDMKYYDKLFGVFQRLHSNEEFEGTGIGLAIVKRIITHHGGRGWAEGKVNEGAIFYFSLPI